MRVVRLNMTAPGKQFFEMALVKPWEFEIDGRFEGIDDADTEL